MSDRDVYAGPLNELAEMVRWAEELFAGWAPGHGMTFFDACRQIAYDRGWDIGVLTTVSANREFNLLIAAAQYVATVRELHGMRTTRAMIDGLRDGREARVKAELSAAGEVPAENGGE